MGQGEARPVNWSQLSVMSFQHACGGISPKIPPLLSCFYTIFLLLGGTLVTPVIHTSGRLTSGFDLMV